MSLIIIKRNNWTIPLFYISFSRSIIPFDMKCLKIIDLRLNVEMVVQALFDDLFSVMHFQEIDCDFVEVTNMKLK